MTDEQPSEVTGDVPGGWRTVALLCVVHSCSSLDRIALPLVFVPLQADLHLTDTQLGFIAGPAFALAYLVASLPWGFLADRISRRAIVITALTLWSLMTFGASIASSFAALALCRVGVGLGEAAIIPSTGSMIGDLFRPRTRPLALGVFFTSAALGLMLSFLGGALIASWFANAALIRLPALGLIRSWRLTLIACSLLGFIVVPVLAAFLREPARTVARGAPSRKNYGFVNFVRRQWMITIGIVVGVPILNAGVYTFLSWVSIFFFRVHGWQVSRTGLVFGLTCGVSALAGSVAVGRLPYYLGRIGLRAPILQACLLIGVAVNLLGAVAVLLPSAALAVFLLFLAFFGFTAASVLGVSMISEVVPPPCRGAFTGLTIVGTGVLTAAAGPLLVGVATQHLFRGPTGIAPALCLVWLFSLMVGGGILLATLPQYRRTLETALV